MTEEPLGVVRHYYPRVHAAVVEIQHGTVREGDTIRIVGHGHDLVEPVRSLELDHERVPAAAEGDTVGILIDAAVKENDEVFLLREDEDDMDAG
ncbi:MAG TPA: hypothetical protein VI818_03960 [Candidatus Thermoplasmatota archaeon]|nr:hypothetical protein [Candidatus Thermoplasmatota archaeon]